MNEFHDVLTGPALPAEEEPAVFDLALACEAMELSRSEIMVLIPQARIEVTTRLEAIREALRAGDQAALIRHSHTIKSVTSALCVEAVSRAAEQLELCARAGQEDQCYPLALALERESARLLSELDRL